MSMYVLTFPHFLLSSIQAPFPVYVDCLALWTSELVTLVWSIEKLGKNVLIYFFHGVMSTKQKSPGLLDFCVLLHLFSFPFFLPFYCPFLEGLLMGE